MMDHVFSVFSFYHFLGRARRLFTQKMVQATKPHLGQNLLEFIYFYQLFPFSHLLSKKRLRDKGAVEPVLCQSPLACHLKRHPGSSISDPAPCWSPRKAPGRGENGPGTRVPVPRGETWMKLQTPDFSLAQQWLLWLFGKWSREWKIRFLPL